MASSIAASDGELASSSINQSTSLLEEKLEHENKEVELESYGEYKIYRYICGREDWPSSSLFSDAFETAITNFYQSVTPELLEYEMGGGSWITLQVVLDVFFDRSYPTQLRNVTEEYLTLFMVELSPLLKSLPHSPSPEEECQEEYEGNILAGKPGQWLWAASQVYLTYIFSHVAPSEGFRVAVHLQSRFEAGLLRDNQAHLVEIVLRLVMGVAKAWVLEVKPRHIEHLNGLRYWSSTEVKDAVQVLKDDLDQFHYVFAFFRDTRFRSERLEVLLVRYLRQLHDINMEVVEGLVSAEREYQLAPRRGPDNRPSRHTLRPEIPPSHDEAGE
ncbi:hypothetical protein BJ508DRAFT_181773 [Ascobolus immersus RN42]|uniref:Uncharacterized protein n=1 Tax=Ascobolus immersus RN42 TaxID=1160509 RepID=A0A3N4I483_ASCIM|nr:hypothetical protein BJ508DRAFT_181773 [Ascobolus immersus RN42]